MDPIMTGNIPTTMLVLSGLIQLIIFIWIFVFPILIIRKLGEIVEALKHK